MNHHWSAFHFILSENISPNINEQLFENKVIQAFGELGWKEYLKNIEVRPTLRIGSTNRIEPDLLFKSDDSRNLFVVEVKRPGNDLIIDNHKQLYSYMRQLKLDYGILIGKEIQIFYDGNLNQSDTPILIEKVQFIKDNPKGENFVELFNKATFNYERLNDFTQLKLNQIDNRKQVNRLKKSIVSEEFKETVLNLIKEHLITDYDPNIVDKILDEIDVDIKDKSNSDIPVVSFSKYTNRNIESLQNPNEDKRRKDGLKIGEYVQRTFRRFMDENRLSSQEITSLLREDYSKQTFGITWKVLRQSAEGTKDNIGNNRYYTRELFGGKYLLTSQWTEKHWDNFLSWERRIQSNK